MLCRSAGNINESPASGLTSERLLRTQCRAGYCQCCTARAITWRYFAIEREPSPPVYRSRWSFVDCSEIPRPLVTCSGSLRRAGVTTAECQSSKCVVLAAFIDSSTLVEFCERALKTMCALSSAGAERVTPIPLRHANGCSPARRLLARASWRPQYPLLPKCTCRSPLATENSQVCRVVDREGEPRSRPASTTQQCTSPVPLVMCLVAVGEMNCKTNQVEANLSTAARLQ